MYDILYFTYINLQLTKQLFLQIYPTDNGGSYSSNPTTPVASPPPLASVSDRPLSGKMLLIGVLLMEYVSFIWWITLNDHSETV